MGIPPQFYQMFFGDGSKNTFNFGGNSKNGKKGDRFGFGDDDDFSSFGQTGFGGFGESAFGGFGDDSDFGGFGQSPFEKFQSGAGPKRQKYKFTSKKTIIILKKTNSMTINFVYLV